MTAANQPPDSDDVAERQRLQAQRPGEANWRLSGPYLAERASGTAREDDRGDGDALDDFPHDQVRFRAYRRNADSLGGTFHEDRYAAAEVRYAEATPPCIHYRIAADNSGQDPAYDWNFGDVNPPGHAMAALKVFGDSDDEDAATHCYQQFPAIANANALAGREGYGTPWPWNDQAGFFMVLLPTPDQGLHRIEIDACAGLIPLVAVAVVNRRTLEAATHRTSRDAAASIAAPTPGRSMTSRQPPMPTRASRRGMANTPAPEWHARHETYPPIRVGVSARSRQTPLRPNLQPGRTRPPRR